jgi:hypothetical protein
LFDGEQPRQDLVQLGGDAATLTTRLSRGDIPLTRRTENSIDYSSDTFLDLRRSYVSQSKSEPLTDSRRQSQVSAIKEKI